MDFETKKSSEAIEENPPVSPEEKEKAFESELIRVQESAGALGDELSSSFERLQQYGEELNFENPQTVAETISTKRGTLEALRKRAREIMKAAAFAFPVLAASPVFAEEEQPQEAAVMTQAADPENDAADNKVIFPDIVTQPQNGSTLTENMRVPQDINEGEPAQLVNAQEKNTPDNEATEKGQEKIREIFGEKRLALFQDFATTLLAKGAGSPEAQKKLLALIGEEIKAGDVPLAVAETFVPFLEGARLIARAVKGKNGNRELTPFEQMKSFAWGIGHIAVDASKIGYIGKNLLNIKRSINALDSGHAIINYSVSAKEIYDAVQRNKNNPYSQEVVQTVISALDKQTLIEQGEGILEEKMRKIYEETVQDPSPFPKTYGEAG